MTKNLEFTFIDTPHVLFYPNGNIYSRGSVNNENKKVGIWEKFHEDGQMKSRGEYKDGMEIGIHKTWFYNGNLRKMAEFENGKIVNFYYRYHLNGMIGSKAIYENNEQVGIETIFYDNGAIKSEIEYKDGGRSGNSIEYYITGEIAIVVKNCNFAYFDKVGFEISEYEYYKIMEMDRDEIKKRLKMYKKRKDEKDSKPERKEMADNIKRIRKGEDFQKLVSKNNIAAAYDLIKAKIK